MKISETPLVKMEIMKYAFWSGAAMWVIGTSLVYTLTASVLSQTLSVAGPFLLVLSAAGIFALCAKFSSCTNEKVHKAVVVAFMALTMVVLIYVMSWPLWR